MISSGEDARAVLLHRRPYTDSKWLVDFLTDKHGRVHGVQRNSQKFRQNADLFVEYGISWRGKSQLVTITHCEPRRAYPVTGKKLYSGLYLNELIVRGTKPQEHVEGLFETYARAIDDIVACDDVEPVLRTFERKFLKGLGYEIIFDHDVTNGARVDPAGSYEYVSKLGFRANGETKEGDIDGESLLAISRDDYSGLPTRRVAKRVLRSALQETIGELPLVSRSLFVSLDTD